MRETGVTEKTLIEMLDFMEKEGIIKLEHPGTKKPGSAPPSGKPSAPSAKEVGFAPMLEESTTPEKPLGGEEGKVFTLVVPHKLKGGMLREIQAKTNLMLKFKQPGVKVFEMINGSRDAVELSIKSGLPLYTVYEILKVLEKDGVVKLEPSVRTEIQRKYGEDGYSVYKRYGREGVMLYQLIGKDMDLRTMARQTSKDKERVVEIFMFIHKLLGIELPIDEDVLLERLKSTTPD
jgi:DNA-binding Lrp family transcriptional regulator